MRRWRGLCAALVVALVVGACSRGEAPAAKPAEAQKPAAEAKPQPVTLPTDPAAVVDLFKAKGLPIGEVIVYTGDDDPNRLLGRPNQYTGKASFLDTRLTRENKDLIDVADGGTVEVFAKEDDARARKTYVDKLGQGASFLTQYGYVQGLVHVRLSKRLTPDQAAQYEMLLKNPAAALTPVPAVAQQAPPTVAPTPAPPKPVAPPPSAASQRVRVTGAGAEGVNMRAEPSTTAARVKVLRDSAQLEIVGEDRQADGRTWRNVKDPADGAVGWIAAEFVTAGDAAPPPPAQQPTAAPKAAAPAAKPAPGSAIVCNDGSTWPNMTRQGACSRRGGIAPGY